MACHLPAAQTRQLRWSTAYRLMNPSAGRSAGCPAFITRDGNMNLSDESLNSGCVGGICPYTYD